MVRITGLVQLKTGDALMGVISGRSFFFRYLRIDNATAMSMKDPDHPSRMDGAVFVPKANVSFIQRALTTVPAK